MRRICAVASLLCGVVLTACSGASDAGIPTANASDGAPSTSAPTRDLVAFARCIREHGIDVADPNPDIDWQQVERDPGWDAAFSACRQLLPPALPGQEGTLPTAEELEEYRAFAVCMRARDIEISDPDPTGNMILGGQLGDLPKAQLEHDPAYDAAYEACKEKLPNRETATK